MVQGSSPTHVFDLSIDTSKISKLRVTYAQNCTTILEKTESEVTMSDSIIKVRLTQQETLQFIANYPVSIQIKLLTTNGVVMVSQIMTDQVESALNKEILS